MFRQDTNKAELEAWGFCEDDFPPEIVEIWPCMSKAVDLFRLVCDQWIMGSGGPVALNLQVPISIMERMNLDDVAFMGMLDDLKIMAGVALRVIADSRSNRG